mmetsp:Transcript_21546/g.52795  ORF Transcript_21546/g.52795 Transcript_21546/m.52795 type:complete len:201 (+) Transcript_21546:365-967(+)
MTLLLPCSAMLVIALSFPMRAPLVTLFCVIFMSASPRHTTLTHWSHDGIRLFALIMPSCVKRHLFLHPSPLLHCLCVCCRGGVTLGLLLAVVFSSLHDNAFSLPQPSSIITSLTHSRWFAGFLPLVISVAPLIEIVLSICLHMCLHSFVISFLNLVRIGFIVLSTPCPPSRVIFLYPLLSAVCCFHSAPAPILVLSQMAG